MVDYTLYLPCALYASEWERTRQWRYFIKKLNYLKKSKKSTHTVLKKFVIRKDIFFFVLLIFDQLHSKKFSNKISKMKISKKLRFRKWVWSPILFLFFRSFTKFISSSVCFNYINECSLKISFQIFLFTPSTKLFFASKILFRQWKQFIFQT